MSFILDALRKSEHDRQRNSAPDIARTGTVAAPPRRRWLVPIIALLIGVNLSLIAALWLMGSDEPDAPPPAAVATARPAARPPVVMGDGARSLQNQLEGGGRPTAMSAKQAPASATVAPAVAARNTPAVNIDYPPTLTELLLDGSLNLPPLRIDVHVYSTKPAERFVFINNARYGEGERLSEGPIITDITDIGVVLRHEGRDFLLTRD
jgi:general secretion pathway protein B